MVIFLMQLLVIKKEKINPQENTIKSIIKLIISLIRKVFA